MLQAKKAMQIARKVRNPVKLFKPDQLTALERISTRGIKQLQTVQTVSILLLICFKQYFVIAFLHFYNIFKNSFCFAIINNMHIIIYLTYLFLKIFLHFFMICI